MALSCAVVMLKSSRYYVCRLQRHLMLARHDEAYDRKIEICGP